MKSSDNDAFHFHFEFCYPRAFFVIFFLWHFLLITWKSILRGNAYVSNRKWIFTKKFRFLDSKIVSHQRFLAAWMNCIIAFSWPMPRFSIFRRWDDTKHFSEIPQHISGSISIVFHCLRRENWNLLSFDWNQWLLSSHSNEQLWSIKCEFNYFSAIAKAKSYGKIIIKIKTKKKRERRSHRQSLPERAEAKQEKRKRKRERKKNWRPSPIATFFSIANISTHQNLSEMIHVCAGASQFSIHMFDINWI